MPVAHKSLEEMKILYLDCPTGISGDMFLASMIDLGVDRRRILGELKKLPIDPSEIKITVRKAVRHSIQGYTFRVNLKRTHIHRTFKEIKKIIRMSGLAADVKNLSLDIFTRIAEAEGKVHGISPEKVHFHEVGAMDSIIDIVGAAIAISALGVERVYCSPLPLGSGWADTMHGRIPIPAPATVEILKGVPTASSDIPFELTTPTGAAIAVTLSTGFGAMPGMTIAQTGYGAGKKDFHEAANLLRAVVGETTCAPSPSGATSGSENLVMLETNIDDMNPQVAGYLSEKLLNAGALDVYYTPVQMKKSRPGVLLNVLTSPDKKEELLELIFTESTSIGIRSYSVERHCLKRFMKKTTTRYGTVRLKVSTYKNKTVNVQPEYEDCKLLAEKKKVPLKNVMEAAITAFNTKGVG